MSDAPDDSLPSEIEVLEREARLNPDSESHQEGLIRALGVSEHRDHPRRLERILDFISRFPRSAFSRSPALQIDPRVAPEAFEAIESLWLRLRNEAASDPDLAIGHAALVALQDRSRSAEILRAAIAVLPENAALWTELGRTAPDASEQLDALQKARALGSQQPNLLAWIGRTAVEVGRFDAVFSIGCELTTRASQTRGSVQPPIDWDDTGDDAWMRIRAVLDDSPDRQLINPLSQYANDTHWAHSFLGLVALEQGQPLEAVHHLLRSAKVWNEPRLSAYGPCVLLARRLCERGHWQDVKEFLIACRDLWEDEILDDWVADVENERVPDFHDT